MNDMGALRAAVKALDKTPEESPLLLPGRLKEIARTKGPGRYQFNHLGIWYRVKDEYNNICLRWTISNGISGRQETYYTKDFMSKNGKVLWRILAAKINHT